MDKDPINHAVLAQAIVAAFSAIEELDFEVKASPQKPSKIDGKWNPVVLEDLKSRLTRAGIRDSETIVWMLRIPNTRIERKYAPPKGDRPSWATFGVRDRLVPMVDAIHYSGLLRSRVSAHRMHDLTRSLSIYDVVNVQHLARKLILQGMGFWRRIGPNKRRRKEPDKMAKLTV